MQVIIGLYVAFPFLFYLLQKYGLKKFLVISALIAYSARVVFWWYGYEPSRESSLFLFYIFEFSVGMAFARISAARPIGIKIGPSQRSLFGGCGFRLCLFIYPQRNSGHWSQSSRGVHLFRFRGAGNFFLSIGILAEMG